MRALPDDPFGIAPLYPFNVAARRTLTVVGAPAELLWLPERRARPGLPQRERPPFPTSIAERIVATETVWRGGGLALTPNRHPFAARHLLLWSEAPRREPDRRMLDVGMALAEAAGGSLLVNSIGAAASIGWAHAHVVGERLPFLEAVPLETAHLDALGEPDGLEVRQAADPFPGLLVALTGPRARRAAAAERLIRLRACAAFNLVDSDGTTWLLPRGRETPSPHFPQALGAAELWGRWCFDDPAEFEAATSDGLRQALQAACAPRA